MKASSQLRKHDPLYIPEDINDEEGEVQYVDNNPYIVDPSLFTFRTDLLHKVNWRNISRINLKSLSNPPPLPELTAIFDQNITDLAYCDLHDEQKRTVFISHEGMQAIRVLQMGMQYLLYQRGTLLQEIHSREGEIERVRGHAERVQGMIKEMKMKKMRHQRIKTQLTEQSIHFEIMLNRLEGRALKERVQIMSEKEKQELLADEESVFHRILKAKGVFDNQFVEREERQAASPPYKQDAALKEIMVEIKKMQGQMDDLKTSHSTYVQQSHSHISAPVQIQTQSIQDSSNIDQSHSQTFSFKHNNTQALLKRDNTFEVTIKPGESEYNDDFDRDNTSSEGIPSARNNFISKHNISDIYTLWTTMRLSERTHPLHAKLHRPHMSRRAAPGPTGGLIKVLVDLYRLHSPHLRLTMRKFTPSWERMAQPETIYVRKAVQADVEMRDLTQNLPSQNT